MGYTGHIILNNENILQEWKSSNTFYSLSYGRAYLRQVGVELRISDINEVLGDIYDTHCHLSYDNLAYTVELVYNLQHIVSNRYNWKDKNHEIYDEDFEEDEKEGVIYIGKYNKFPKFVFKSAFVDEIIAEKYLDLMRTGPITKTLLITMIEELLEIQEKIITTLKGNRDVVKESSRFLIKCIEDIKNGDTIRCRCSPNKKNELQFYSMKTKQISTLIVDDEYYYYNLFGSNHWGQLYASCHIRNKADLMKLISSFDKSQNRTNYIEKRLIDYYNSISDNEVFDLDIDGSF